MIVKTALEVQAALKGLPEGTLIFLDVDDTLITPKSCAFRSDSPYKRMIDELKANKDQYPQFEKILSHWRLSRETILVDDEWPQVIQDLKLTHSVFGLTKMETGSLGDIPSMEEWRFQELCSKGIHFTPAFPGKIVPISFYQGIFMTGPVKKSDILADVFKIYTPPYVAFIDDREEQIEDVSTFCERESLPFLGLHYTGAELIPGKPDSAVANFQQNHLFTKGEWLEDEVAKYLLERNAELDTTELTKKA